MPKGETTINYTLCMACGCCIQACPFSCLQFSRTGLDPYNKQYPELVTGNQCTGCGACASACITDCITVIKH